MVLRKGRLSSRGGGARSVLLVLAAGLVLLLAGTFAFAWSGLYDVAADAPHTAPVHRLLETVRERSIHARAARLQVPADLSGEARIVQGSGNYDAMCKGCHLAPGMAATELSRGLYPAPPDLTRETVEAAEAFWVIKHGIKASGMPAWGASMDDAYVWNMAAFLQVLPGLDAAEYGAMVARSGGHDHGGGETPPHDHGWSNLQDDDGSASNGDVATSAAPAPAPVQLDADAPAPPGPEAASDPDAAQDAARPASEPHDHHAHEH